MIRTFPEPFKPKAGIAVLRGNLAPNGAVIKPSAAGEHLMRHTGRADLLTPSNTLCTLALTMTNSTSMSIA